MFKKKYLILLSTLLLVLLLGLSTTCYADHYRIWNKSMVQNFIYGVIMRKQNPTYTDAQARQYIAQLDSKIDDIVDELNSNYHVILWVDNGYSTINIATSNSNTTVYMNGSRLSSTNSVWKTHQISWWANVEQVYNGYIQCLYNYQNNYIVADETIYSNSNLLQATIIHAGGSVLPNANILTSPYTNDFFDYSYNSSLDDLTVPKVNETIKSMTYSQFRTEYVAEVGMLKFLDYVSVGQFYWDNSINDWKLLRYNNNYIVNNDTTSDSLLEVFCPLDWWYGNTLITFEALSRPGAEYGGVYNFWVYLKDNNTVINNGALNVGSFSGDYDNNIQNDIQHEQTIDAINDIKDTITDDSQVDGMLNEFTSGDMATKLGYKPLENPFTAFLYNFLTGLCDTLLGSGDVTLNLDIHGNIFTLHSTDYSVPNGILKDFLSITLTSCYCFIMYKYFNHLLHKLEMADLKGLKNEFASEDDSSLM